MMDEQTEIELMHREQILCELELLLDLGLRFGQIIENSFGCQLPEGKECIYYISNADMARKLRILRSTATP